MLDQLKQDLHHIDLSDRNIKIFLGILVMILVFAVYRSGLAGKLFLYTGLLFLLLAGLGKPALFRGFYRAWMTVAVTIGWVVSNVIFSLFFFLIISPIAFIAKASGRDTLKLSRTGEESYFRARQQKTDAMEKQY